MEGTPQKLLGLLSFPWAAKIPRRPGSPGPALSLTSCCSGSRASTRSQARKRCGFGSRGVGAQGEPKSTRG